MTSAENRPAILLSASPDRSLPLFEFSNHPAIPEVVSLAEGEEFVVTYDQDETVWDTVRNHHSRLNRYYTLMANLSAEERASLPTHDAIVQAGGLQPYSHLPGFDALHARMVAHNEFNRNLPLLHQDHPKLLQELATTGFKPVLSLTTRPDNIEKLSREELIKAGFPNVPVIARPNSVDTRDTVPWKVAGLVYVATRIKAHIFMIDDNVKLYDALVALGHRRIHPILYPGPITQEIGDRNAADWDEMLPLLQSMTQKG